jgi:hypothetical protein
LNIPLENEYQFDSDFIESIMKFQEVDITIPYKNRGSSKGDDDISSDEKDAPDRDIGRDKEGNENDKGENGNDMETNTDLAKGD